ncbi:piggyBac transposable element-derived protein 3-like [Stegodyphus dumicola]|uniref:piggyBac transposable element-derived protein 3-like n=1 Tax=Stegodyphus dumicola TaxID=202533 RepID=UPI0015AA1B15|nr:piggyBac transposable element-derived protein 3-like [Stegodyphus dumicola]
MSVQRFLKLEEALELFNSFDSDESEVEIAVLPPDASELTDEDEGEENEVNTGDIIVTDVPGSLCGKESDARNDTSLDTRFVMKLTQNIMNPSSYTLYFDNLFTSTYLLKSLAEQSFRATVTIRENRINHEFPLEESKSMRKKERGTSDFAVDEKSEIFLVRWNENSTVTVATNFSTLQPFFDLKRRVRGHKDKVNVKMPNLINSYNKRMGGVDHHDWLAELYSIKIRGKSGTGHFLYVRWIWLS